MNPRIFFIILPLIYTNLNAQDFDSQIFNSYTQRNIGQWLKTLEESRKSSKTVNFEQVLAQYGLIGFLLEEKKEKEAITFLNELEIILEKSIVKQSENASLLAIRAALVGYRISISPYKAPYLGGKSVELLAKALAIDPQNAYVRCEMGNSLFYRPAVFGGSKAEAIKHYTLAISILEKQNKVSNNWYYLNTLNTLGQAYEKTGHLVLAKSTFEKALQIAPDFLWLKNVHFPEFKKKNKLK